MLDCKFAVEPGDRVVAALSLIRHSSQPSRLTVL
jgi:hypothetical protein